MVLSAIWSFGWLELVECQSNINSAKYVSILQEGLLPIFSSGYIIKHDSLFMKDEAPCHTADSKLVELKWD